MTYNKTVSKHASTHFFKRKILPAGRHPCPWHFSFFLLLSVLCILCLCVNKGYLCLTVIILHQCHRVSIVHEKCCCLGVIMYQRRKVVVLIL